MRTTSASNTPRRTKCVEDKSTDANTAKWAVGFGVALLFSAVTTTIDSASSTTTTSGPSSSKGSYSASQQSSSAGASQQGFLGWESFPEFLHECYNEFFANYQDLSHSSHGAAITELCSLLHSRKRNQGKKVGDKKEEDEEDDSSAALSSPPSEHNDISASHHSDAEVLSMCTFSHSSIPRNADSFASLSDDDRSLVVFSPKAASSSSNAVSLEVLPVEVLRRIYSYLALPCVGNCATVSKQLYAALPYYQQSLVSARVLCVKYAAGVICSYANHAKRSEIETVAAFCNSGNLSSSTSTSSQGHHSATSSNTPAGNGASPSMNDGSQGEGQAPPLIRLFLGQLRKDVTPEFVKFFLATIGVDLASEVAHIEMHTAAQGTRAKGCAWVDVRSMQTCNKIQAYDKRAFLDVESTGVGSKDEEVLFVVANDNASREWLNTYSVERSKDPLRPHTFLSRNPIVVEVPKPRKPNAPLALPTKPTVSETQAVFRPQQGVEGRVPQPFGGAPNHAFVRSDAPFHENTTPQPAFFSFAAKQRYCTQRGSNSITPSAWRHNPYGLFTSRVPVTLK